MKKSLLIIFSMLVVSSNVFSADKVDYNKPFDEIKEQVSDFDQRHSLMSLKSISKNEEQNTVIDEKKSDDTNLIVKTDEPKKESLGEPIRIEKDKIVNVEQKNIVKESVKPVFVVQPTFPEEDKKAMDEAKEELKQALFIPDVNDDEGYDLLSDDEENKSNINVAPKIEEVKQSEEKKTDEPFVLKQVPEKKYDGTDIIFSNVIDEKADNVVNYPLLVNKPKKQEVKVEEKQKTEEIKTSDLLVNEKVENKEDLPRTISAPIAVKKVEPLEESKDILTAHIASYSTKDSAEKGITLWKEKYPLITLLKHSIKYENVPEKGIFYRLYLTGDEAKLENLCNQMKANKDWCNILR